MWEGRHDVGPNVCDSGTVYAGEIHWSVLGLQLLGSFTRIPYTGVCRASRKVNGEREWLACKTLVGTIVLELAIRI